MCYICPTSATLVCNRCICFTSVPYQQPWTYSSSRVTSVPHQQPTVMTLPTVSHVCHISNLWAATLTSGVGGESHGSHMVVAGNVGGLTWLWGGHTSWRAQGGTYMGVTWASHGRWRVGGRDIHRCPLGVRWAHGETYMGAGKMYILKGYMEGRTCASHGVTWALEGRTCLQESWPVKRQIFAAYYHRCTCVPHHSIKQLDLFSLFSPWLQKCLPMKS